MRPTATRRRWRGCASAGALIVGKTNLDQFATGLVGVRTPYPVPRNACDPTLVPGGSSSGSAVAVARGIVALALGTDTAGSGRVPAALNNIVGLKPSVGAVSTRGVVPACRTLDCVSVLALTVEDAWAALRRARRLRRGGSVLAPPAAPQLPAAPAGRCASASRRSTTASSSASGIGGAPIEAAWRSSAALGATIVPIPFADFYAVGALLYEGAWVAERYAAIREMIEARPESLHPVTREIIDGATKLSASRRLRGHLQAEGAGAQDRAGVVGGRSALRAVDPVALHARRRRGRSDRRQFAARHLHEFRQPARPLRRSPCRPGSSTDGRPSGVTLIGPSGADGLLAAIAARPASWPRPRRSARPAWPLEPRRSSARRRPPGRIEVAVVGAHLSGMPLNGQLVGLGGIFARAVRTAPRLPPLRAWRHAREARVCCAAGPARAAPSRRRSGRSRAEGFGRLVASVPPPLSIGTLELEDGTSRQRLSGRGGGGARRRRHFAFRRLARLPQKRRAAAGRGGRLRAGWWVRQDSNLQPDGYEPSIALARGASDRRTR